MSHFKLPERLEGLLWIKSDPGEKPCALCGKNQVSKLSDFTIELKIRIIASRNCKFQEACAPLAKTLCALCGKNKSVNTTLSPFIPLCGTSSAEKTRFSSRDDCTSELKIRSITSRNCKFQEACAPLAKTLCALCGKNKSVNTTLSPFIPL
ncbi:hypothetical protein CLV48_12128 [Cecembia rubra]|uniref:Uncharacterized protein n=1 Tax=Cecembia rubra TaxID=1485585 RepID=A0A2P8DKB2_9BACT|nr:hypothetical protein CLV48_12128 [Cecembia rubra]